MLTLHRPAIWSDAEWLDFVERLHTVAPDLEFRAVLTLDWSPDAPPRRPDRAERGRPVR